VDKDKEENLENSLPNGSQPNDGHFANFTEPLPGGGLNGQAAQKAAGFIQHLDSKSPHSFSDTSGEKRALSVKPESTSQGAGFISLSEASKLTGYHQDYLGFLCRNGKLKGFKLGRNWVTTKADIDEFVASYKNGINEVIDERGSKIQVHVEKQINADSENGLTQIGERSGSGTPQAVSIGNLSSAHLIEQPIPQPSVPQERINTLKEHLENLATKNEPVERLSSLRSEVFENLENRIQNLSGELSKVEKAVAENKTEPEKKDTPPEADQPLAENILAVGYLPEQQRGGLKDKFASNFGFGDNDSKPNSLSGASANPTEFALNKEKVKNLYQSFVRKEDSSLPLVLACVLIALLGLAGSFLWSDFATQQQLAKNPRETKIVYQGGQINTDRNQRINTNSSSSPGSVIVNRTINQLLGFSSSDIYNLIDDRLNQYLAEGKFKGEKGDQGPQGLQGNGSTISYVQPNPSNGSSGGSMAGFTYLSSQDFVTNNATVNNLLTSNGNAVFNGITNNGTTNLNGSTTIVDLTVSNINPGFAQGSVVFQGANGLTQDNNLFYDASTTRLGIGTNTPNSTLAVAGTMDVFGTSTLATATIANLNLTQPLALASGGLGFDASAISKGGLIAGTGSGTLGIQAVGSNGLCLIASSTSASGLEWASCAIAANAITSLNGLTNPVQTFATGSDTNIGLNISSANGVHTFTPYFTGTLAADRLNPNVVQGTVNDTNITGSILNQVLTLGWSGQLSVARGGTGTSTLASLTVGSNLNISGGQNVLIGTSTQITLSANPIFTSITATATSSLGDASAQSLTVTSATTTINGVSYYWPASQSANSFLMTNGSGGLSWNSTSTLFGGTPWLLGGNTLTSTGTLGTLSANDLNFITNSTTRLTILSGGNVGIGTTNPATTLSLQGTSGTDLLNIASSTGTSVFYIKQNGNVGIGTTSPSQLLTVGNNNQFTVSSGGNLNVVGTSVLTGTAQIGGYLDVGYTYTNKIFTNKNTAIDWGGGSSFATAPDTGLSRLSPGVVAVGNGTAGDYSGTLIAGNVGIGTTTPAYKLDVKGENNTTGQLYVMPLSTPSAPTVTATGTTGSTNYGYEVVARVGSGNTAASSQTLITNGNATLDSTNKNILSWTAISGATSYDIYRTTSSGTPATTGKIANTSSLTLNDTGLAGSGSAPASNTTGYVGINQSNPTQALEVVGNIFLHTTPATMYFGSGSTYFGINSGNFSFINAIGGLAFGVNTTSPITFATNSTNRMTIDSLGNLNVNSGQLYVQQSTGSVGIGTTSPASKLQVLGDIQIGSVATTTAYGLLFNSGNANGYQVRLTATSTQNASYTLTLPTTTPVANNLMMTDSSGNLSFVATTTLGLLAASSVSGSVNQAAFYNGTNTLSGSNNFLWLNTAQQLSVNSSTPTATLVVQASSSAQTLPIFTVASSSNATYLTVLANGNVGIGTSTPVSGLDIATGLPQLTLGALNQPGRIVLRRGSDAAGAIFIGYTGSGDSTNLSLQSSGGGSYMTFFTAGNERMRIDTTGNVGIGSTTPSYKLVVAGENSTVGNLYVMPLGTPATPTLAASGTGATSLSYAVVAKLVNGGLVPSAVVSTTTAPNTLDANNNITVNWTAVSGAIYYDVYRTAAGGTPSSTGTVATNLTTLTFKDTGGAAIVASLPLANTTGRVGIGTTSPLSRLDVWGNFNVATGSTPALFVNTATGAVGVGTNSPNGMFEVVGQCVTGDTRLRRRRRKLKVKSDKFKVGGPGPEPGGGDGDKDEYEYDEVRIDQISPGDEILTLDENSGKFVWQKIRQLQGMGIQETYRLVTQSGKKIETTGNHPYFVIPEISSQRSVFKRTAFEVDQSQRIEKMNQDSFVAIANEEQSFTVQISKQVKRQLFAAYANKGKNKLFGPELFASLVTAALRVSELVVGRLVLDIEYPGYEAVIINIIKKSFPEIIFEIKSVGRKSPAHFAAKGAYLGKREINWQIKSPAFGLAASPSGKFISRGVTSSSLKGNLVTELLHIRTSRTIRNPHSPVIFIDYQKGVKVSSGKAEWKKVSYLRPGMLIATIDGWEKISHIYPVGRQQVYDIEVEGTHNFVGNDIVAHNTAIFDNRVSIGTSSPVSNVNLYVQGQSGNTPLVVASSSGSTLLTVLQNGNVGIGTTSPSQSLTVGNNNQFTVTSGGALTAVSGAIGALSANTNGISISSANNGQMSFFYANNTNYLYPYQSYNRAEGTTGALLPVQAGDYLGATNFYGYNGASYAGAAGFNAVVVATTTSGYLVGKLQFSVGDGTSGGANYNALSVTASTTTFSNSVATAFSSGNVNVATLTTSSLVMSDAGKNLASVTLGAGLTISGNTLNTTAANDVWKIGNGLIYNATSTDLVGIGTNTPTTSLFVQGKAGVNPFAIASSTGNQLLTVLQNGNVGIGTTSPAYKLDVNGTIGNSSGAISISAGGTNQNITLTPSGTGYIDPYTGANNTMIRMANTKFLGTDTGQVYIWSSALAQSMFSLVGTNGNPTVQGGGGYFWTGTTNSTGSLTAGISRLSNGVLAIGNGTAGDYSGTLIAGNVGIGTTSPAVKLQVMGSVLFSGPSHSTSTAVDGELYYDSSAHAYEYFYAPSSTYVSLGNGNISYASSSLWVQSGSNIYYNNSGGSVAINASTSLSNLGVYGNVSIGQAYQGIAAPTDGLIVKGNVGIGVSAPATTLSLQGTSGTDLLNIASSTGTSVLYISQKGYVGIGTTAPEGRVQINGADALYSTAAFTIYNSTPTRLMQVTDDGRVYLGGGSFGAANGVLNVSSSVGVAGHSPVANFQDSNGTLALSGNGFYTGATSLGFGPNSAGASFNMQNTKNYAVNLYGDGTNGANVMMGIGMNAAASPTATLDIRGYGTNTPFSVASSSGASLMIINTSGNVGIGTTSPTSKLHIVDSAVPNITLDDGSARVVKLLGGAATQNAGLGTYYNANFGLFTNSLQRVTIQNDGNVGIGTTSPNSKLQVWGNLTVGTSSTPTIFVDTANNAIGINTTSNISLGPIVVGNGAYLSAGGTWGNNSDVNSKENFSSLNPQDILNKIDSLAITQWSYKAEGPSIVHIGPMAQDFYAAFKVGNSPTSISTIDPAGVALLGIQALDQKILALQGAINSASTATTSLLAVYNPSNFSGDSVGEAKILAGSTSVRVTFSQAYEYQPIVTITPIGGFAPAYVTDVDASGFTIAIDEQVYGQLKLAPTDSLFSWHSFASPQAQLTVSNGSTTPIELVLATTTSDVQIVVATPDTTYTTDTTNASDTPAVLGDSTTTPVVISTSTDSSAPAPTTPTTTDTTNTTNTTDTTDTTNTTDSVGADTTPTTPTTPDTTPADPPADQAPPTNQ